MNIIIIFNYSKIIKFQKLYLKMSKYITILILSKFFKLLIYYYMQILFIFLHYSKQFISFYYN